MKKILSLAVIGAAALAAPVLRADPVTLDFEGLANFTEVLQSYDGFQFSAGAYAFVSQTLGGTGSFYGGAAGSTRGALILDGVSDLPNGMQRLRVQVTEGFGSFFSVSVGFLPGTTLSIQAFDANGQLLAGTAAANFSGGNGCTPPGFICQWTTVRLSLDAGVQASSIELLAPGGAGWLDDLSFGSISSPVPEPGTAWLSLCALAGWRLNPRRRLQLPR